jgi:rod shape-determining protein MreD
MSARTIALALLVLVTTVAIQTTALGPGSLQLFGASPNLVTLVVIGLARYLDDEPAILIGFTAGVFLDSLGSSVLGLWAMSETVVAYATLRLRDRSRDGILVVALGVAVLTIAGQALFAVAGTLFGERFLTDIGVARRVLLPGLYNMVIAAVLLPGIRRIMTDRRAASAWMPR